MRAHPVCKIAIGVLALVALARPAIAATETVLYSFTSRADGAFPSAGLIRDAAGNLYGTAAYGGDTTCNPPNGCGVVFKITP